MASILEERDRMLKTAEESLVRFVNEELHKQIVTKRLISYQGLTEVVEERYTWFVELDKPLKEFDNNTDSRYVLKSRRKWAHEWEVEGATAFTALSPAGQGYHVVSSEEFFICRYID